MVTCDGYMISQRKNAVLITMPQTWETMTSTMPLSNRRAWLTTEQEAILLNIVIQLLEGEE